MAVWDAFLSEDDRKVMAARKPRKPHGPGKKNALLLIDMQMTAMGNTLELGASSRKNHAPRNATTNCWSALAGSSKRAGARVSITK